MDRLYLYLGQHNRGFSIFRINGDGSLQLVSTANNGGKYMELPGGKTNCILQTKTEILSF